jgi:hypothetical protein
MLSVSPAVRRRVSERMRPHRAVAPDSINRPSRPEVIFVAPLRVTWHDINSCLSKSADRLVSLHIGDEYSRTRKTFRLAPMSPDIAAMTLVLMALPVGFLIAAL